MPDVHGVDVAGDGSGIDDLRLLERTEAALRVVEIGFLLREAHETLEHLQPSEGVVEVAARDGFLHVALGAVVFLGKADG